MVDLVKQDMTHLWANTGDIVAPDNTKIDAGWAVETVPRQWWNWMQNRVDTNVAYALQKGIPEWDASTEYIVNKSYVQYMDVLYKCIQTNTNQTPATAPLYWVKALVESTAAMEALKTVTPAANTLPYFTNGTTASTTSLTAFARTILDDADAAAVRTTIGAQLADATLTALAGVATATNTIIYFTGVDAAAATTLSAFGRTLIDDADAATARTTLGLGSMAVQNSGTVSITGGTITGITDLAIADGGTGSSTASGARTNLGLGTAAVENITTSTTDTTVGRLLKVGDHGLGAELVSTEVDLNNYTAGGKYITPATGLLNLPSGWVQGRHIVEVAGGINYRSQIITGGTANLGRVAVRTASATIWQPWVEVWTSANTLAIGTTAASARTALGLANSATIAASQSATANTLAQRTATGGVDATEITSVSDIAISPGLGGVTIGHEGTTRIYTRPTGAGVVGGLLVDQQGGSISLRGNTTGVGNVAYMTFNQSDDTRDGYVGVPAPSNRSVYVTADAGDVNIFPVLGSANLFEAQTLRLATTPVGVNVTGTVSTDGIAFPASQISSANANTLDDYEEGTWTPTITFSTPGTLSVAYAIQDAKYTKIGRVVHVSFRLQTSTFTLGTASGNLHIQGLPFTVTGNVHGGGMGWQGITKAGYTDMEAVAVSVTTRLEVIASGSGVARGNVLASNMPTGGTVGLFGQITYTV